MEVYKLLSIPMQNTEAAEVLHCAEGVLSRRRDRTPRNPAMKRAILRLAKDTENLAKEMSENLTRPGNDAKGKIYTKLRGTFGSLEYDLKAGLGLPKEEVPVRQAAAEVMHKALFGDGRADLAKDAEKLHTQVGLALRAIDESFQQHVKDAEVVGLVELLKKVHAEGEKVLHLGEKEEPPELRAKKKAVLRSLRAVIIQANAWAQDVPDDGESAFFYLVPIERWLERAKEARKEAEKQNSDSGNPNGGDTGNAGDAAAEASKKDEASDETTKSA